MNKTIVIAGLIALLVGIGGFVGGTYYQRSQATSRFAQFGSGTGGQGGQFYRRFGQAGANANVVRGQVVSTDENTVTVKLMDGSSKILVIGSSTSFMKSTSGSLSDLKAGDTVMAFGTANSDGSVTAQNVEINPPMRGPMPSSTPTK